MNSFFERDLEQLFWDWPIDYHKHFFTHKVTTVTFGLIFLYTQYSDYFVDSYRGADIYKKNSGANYTINAYKFTHNGKKNRIEFERKIICTDKYGYLLGNLYAFTCIYAHTYTLTQYTPFFQTYTMEPIIYDQIYCYRKLITHGRWSFTKGS